MRGRLAAVILAAVPLSLAACGKSDESKVRDVLDEVNSSDPAVCSKLSDQLLKSQFNGDKGRCRAQARRVTQKSLFTVKSVDVSGDTATATVKAKTGGRSRVLFKKEGGDWKVQSIRPG
jgi:type IV pilus biogenesis protein CpaD/CtpE